uniref:F-box domain-containing protein n=1 Tax=Caenorhabditis tropicalis TaxID=1561998 RepID=A0A1I7UTS0_9PELO
MDLLRLPLLVLIDVFKNMDNREKFLISFMSKRAKNTLNLTSAPSEFSFQLSESFLIQPEEWDSRIYMKTNKENYLIGGELMRLSFNPRGITLKNETPRNQLLLASHVLDAFPKSTISVAFYDPILPATALEFMTMINQRKFFIKAFTYCMTEVSSFKFVPELLDECTKVTESIKIHAAFPDVFVYTPLRPFKAASLKMFGNTNWFDLENFMSCRDVIIKLRIMSKRTAQTYNSFFSKWMDSDGPLQKLTLFCITKPEYRMIMDALNNQLVSLSLFVIKFNILGEPCNKLTHIGSN